MAQPIERIVTQPIEDYLAKNANEAGCHPSGGGADDAGGGVGVVPAAAAGMGGCKGCNPAAAAGADSRQEGGGQEPVSVCRINVSDEDLIRQAEMMDSNDSSTASPADLQPRQRKNQQHEEDEDDEEEERRLQRELLAGGPSKVLTMLAAGCPPTSNSNNPRSQQLFLNQNNPQTTPTPSRPPRPERTAAQAPATRQAQAPAPNLPVDQTPSSPPPLAAAAVAAAAGTTAKTADGATTAAAANDVAGTSGPAGASVAAVIAPEAEKESPLQTAAAAATVDDDVAVTIEARVKISETRDSSFFVPLPLLDRRELEMRQIADSFNVPGDKWTGSRLHSVYHTQRNDEGDVEDTHPVVIRLDPATYMRGHNLSHNFAWTVWLTDLVQGYYERGTLDVPAIEPDAPTAKMKGNQVLLALEYLGILYKPEQLKFGNAQAYHEVKRWSRYLTIRTELANHVLADIETRATSSSGGDKLQQQERHSFCICADESANPTSSPVLATSRVRAGDVFDLFSSPNAADMRGDFCAYLHHLRSPSSPRSSRIHARFVQSSNKTLQKHWLLHVRRSHPSSRGGGSRSVMHSSTFTSATTATSGSSMLMSKDKRDSLPYPLDELVEEDLQQGTLERLIQEAQERTQKQQEQLLQEHQERTDTTTPRVPSSPSATSPRRVAEYPHQESADGKGDDDDDDGYDELRQLMNTITSSDQQVHGSKKETEVSVAEAGTPGDLKRDECPDPDAPGKVAKPDPAAKNLALSTAPLPPTPPRPTSAVAGQRKEATFSPASDAAAAAASRKAPASKPPRAATPPRATAPVTSPSPITVTDDGAPIRVVRASSGNQSVTSALTGPIFYETEEDESDTAKDHYLLRSPALASSPRRYRDWAQNKDCNNGDGISTRVRALLDDATDLDESLITSIPTSALPAEGAEADGDPNMMSWDWITEVVCHFPRVLLQETTQPSLVGSATNTALKNQESKRRTESSKASNGMAVEKIVGATASNMIRNVEENTTGIFEPNACGFEDPTRESSGDGESRESDEYESFQRRKSQPQKYRDVVVLEETDVSASKMRKSRSSSTAATASSGPPAPARVKDRLYAIQKKTAAKERQKDTSKRQGVAAGPEKEVVLSSGGAGSPDPTAAESSSSCDTEESAVEYYKPVSTPPPHGSTSAGTPRKRSGVRFLFRKRRSSQTQ